MASNQEHMLQEMENYRIILRNLQLGSKMIFPNTRLPESKEDMYKICTQNQNSIFNSLPQETVKIINGHSYISLSEKLDIMCAHGVVYDFNSLCDEHQDFVDLMATRAGSALRQRMRNMTLHDVNQGILKVGYYILWSDGFTKHHIKTHKGSIWVLTATVCPPEGNTSSKFHTYLLACGPGNSTLHTSVIDIYLHEIEHLKKPKWRYNGTTKRMEYTAFEMLLFLTDRPERCSVNFLKSLGTTGLRSRYSGWFEPKTFASCHNCFCDRLRSFLPETIVGRLRQPLVCHVCCDFSCDNTSEAGYTKTDDKYPTKTHDDAPNPPSERPHNVSRLRVMEQTYEKLTKCVQFMAYNLATKTWYDYNGRSYFESLALKSSLYDTIKEEALRLAASNELHVIKTNQFSAIPRIWLSGYQLHQFVDSPMHLLFQGIMKSMIKVFRRYLVDISLHTKFAKHANITLRDVFYEHIDWCKADMLHTKEFTTGGWIGETFLAYAQMIPILYTHIFELHLYKDKRDGHKEFNVLVSATHCMIAHLMTRQPVAHSTTNNLVKLFLSACSKFAKISLNSENINFWYKKGNFISLLNLADQIQHYGPLRNYYEATRESFIQQIKPTLATIRYTDGYFEAKMLQHHRKMALDYVNDKPNIKVYKRNRQYRCYKTIGEVQDAFDNDMPLSTCVLPTHPHTMFCVIRTHSKSLYQLIPITFSMMSKGVHFVGLWYEVCIMSLHPDGIVKTSTEKFDNDVCHFCLSFSNNEDNDLLLEDKEKLRCVITSDWLTRKEGGEYLLPLPDFRVYAEYMKE